jgi:hypothetical protein
MTRTRQTINWLILLLLNLLLLFVNSRLNTFISTWGLHLYWDGLLIVYPALHMGSIPGLLLMIITDMLIYSGLFLFVRSFQKRINIDHGLAVQFIAQICNLIAILINSLVFLPSSKYWGAYFSQTLIMTLLSQASLAFITFWVYQLQFCTIQYLSLRFGRRNASQLL